ncbi:MAG: hypothetical protein MI802_07985, partial [Desulfobacterales bacterium]|nr:hypothetical protein [Desulfobacterales bacterium]
TESKQLIRYRLNCCFVPGKEKHLFSVPALWVIHRFSNGSPRKMITLCHQVILAIIVREKKKADFFLARACARNALHSNEQPPLGRRLLAPVMIMLLMLMGGGYFWNQALHIPESSPPPVVIEKEIPVNREKAPPPRQPNPIKASVGIAPVAAPLPAPQSTENSENITDSGKSSAVKRTKGYGRATVPRDTTLYAMISRVYGRFSRPLLNTLMAANPQIKAPEQVKYGHRLFFPSPPENIPPEKGVYLVLRKTSQFEEAFALALSDKKTPMKLLTYPTGKTYEFFVVMDQTFPSLSAAREFAKHHLKTEKPIALEFPPVPEPQTTGQAS